MFFIQIWIYLEAIWDGCPYFHIIYCIITIKPFVSIYPLILCEIIRLLRLISHKILKGSYSCVVLTKGGAFLFIVPLFVSVGIQLFLSPWTNMDKSGTVCKQISLKIYSYCSELHSFKFKIQLERCMKVFLLYKIYMCYIRRDI